MNMSQHYYLKEGKLELNMLDDEDDEEGDGLQPTLQVSKEVYNTLHVMGQYLTHVDEKEHFNNIGGDITPTEKIMFAGTPLESMASSDASSVGMSPTHIPCKEQAISQRLNEDCNGVIAAIGSDEVAIPPLESGWNKELKEENSTIKQKRIDDLVDSFFVLAESKQPPNEFMAELKRHIDKQIEALKNYE